MGQFASRNFLVLLLLLLVSPAVSTHPHRRDPAAFRDAVATLHGLAPSDWLDGNALVAHRNTTNSNDSLPSRWHAALAACSDCRLNLSEINGGDGSALTREIQRFRALPARQFYWNRIFPAVVHTEIAPKLKDGQINHALVRVLSVGLQWYSIEDEYALRRHLEAQGLDSDRVEFVTMDMDPRTFNLAPAIKGGLRRRRHVVGDATELPDSCHSLAPGTVHVVLLNGVIGWGVNDPAAVAQLMRAVATMLQPDGLLVVGRNIPRLCCSNGPFSAAGFAPTRLTLPTGGPLPHRRVFAQTPDVGGGHVFDVQRLRRNQLNTKSTKNPTTTTIEVPIRLTLNIDGQSAELALAVQLSPSEPEEKRARAVAADVCANTLQMRGEAEQQQCVGTMAIVVERFLRIARLETNRNLGCAGRRRLMVVAHPDDELLFGGRSLLSEAACWTVVSVTNANEAVRAKEFRRSIDLAGAEGVILPFADNVLHLPFEYMETAHGASTGASLEDWLHFFARLLPWERVLTHGPLGEYGHPQHIALHQMVRDILVEYNKDGLMWVFSPAEWRNVPAAVSDRAGVSFDDDVAAAQAELAVMVYRSQEYVVGWFLQMRTEVVPAHKFSFLGAGEVGCHQTETAVPSFAHVIRNILWVCRSHLRAWQEGAGISGSSNTD